MKRRDFTALGTLAGMLGALGTPGLSFAQGAPVEGKNYLRLGNPLPTPAGKIEVLEFFQYTCPHCYALDPVLTEWAKRQPADVVLRRVALGFSLHQKLFFALEAMGKEGLVHAAIFDTFQRQHIIPDNDADIISLAVHLGIDRNAFTQMYNSFGMQAKVSQANKLAEDYGINSVPTLTVGGRFVTSPALAGGSANEQQAGQLTLAVTDTLIQQVRSGKR